ncbi:MAG: PHP domain-containing protein [Gemmatimonadota bacterium]|nr:PHP domain-containing protein [Gemmatimonadota bacterium]
MKLDLHVHSNASDGAWAPADVVRAARAGGLDVLAISDHDTTAACGPAVALGVELQIQVVPAIEVSSSHEGQDIHVLGYFVDPEAPRLRDHERRALSRRETRMHEMLAKLADLGIDIPFEAVERVAGPDRVALGRPHLAKALLEAGHVPTVSAAFDTFIADDGPAFVPTHMLTPMEAIEIILEADGLPVWAHPPGGLVDDLLPPMVEAGLRGIEVYRPWNRRDHVLRLERVCRSTGLLPTGGSDWHGPDGGTALGDFSVTADEVEAFLEAGGL